MQPAQDLVSFEEVAVRFTEEGRDLLDPGQKALHREITLENYGIVASLEDFPKPAFISRLEEGECAFLQDLQKDAKSAEDVRKSALISRLEEGECAFPLDIKQEEESEEDFPKLAFISRLEKGESAFSQDIKQEEKSAELFLRDVTFTVQLALSGIRLSTLHLPQLFTPPQGSYRLSVPAALRQASSCLELETCRSSSGSETNALTL